MKPLDSGFAQWLTRGALIALLAIVVARMTTLEILRDPFEASPGSQPIPRGAGAASSLMLDLVAMLPALLILFRALIDRSFALVCRWSFLPLLLLAAWCVASTLWASDKFAALVTSLHWLTASTMLWSAAQLMRTPAHIRILCGTCAGLLLVLIAQGVVYRLVELPDLKRSILADKERIFRERGWDPGSFSATQFERKVLSGEMVGFNASPNSYAALLVLLGIIGSGVVIQRFSDGAGSGWIGVGILSLPLWAVLIWWTQSKAAMLTPVVGAILLVGWWLARGFIAQHRRAVLLTCAVGAIGVALAIVGVGISRGSLPSDSLNFRWRYWVGAARLVAERPVTGFGWSNFANPYLHTRLPDAAEEIKDPHNFIMHFATELGIVGALLFLTWLGSFSWECFARRNATDDFEDSPVMIVVWIAIAAVVLAAIASIDFTQNAGYVVIELLKKLLQLGLLIIAGILVAVRSPHDPKAETRSAPWMMVAISIALLLFLAHNTIDFSMFEYGATALAMTLCGALLRAVELGKTCSRRMVLPAFVGAGVVWLSVLALAITVTVAESNIAEADEALRTNQPHRAASLYSKAQKLLPVANGDYLIKAARAALFAQQDPSQSRPKILEAIAADRLNPSGWRLLAVFESAQTPVDLSAMQAAFDEYLKLNPGDIAARVEYADQLTKLNERQRAFEAYREALRRDDLLHQDEPRRLTPEQKRQIEQKISIRP